MTSSAPGGASPALDPRALLEVAEDLARRAGVLAEEGRRAGVEVAAVKSSPVDVVTELDRAAERLIREGLRAARPRDGVLGEEFGLEEGDSGVTWVVDPIDGTVNFLYGLAGYAVSIAAVTGDALEPGRWQPLAGCVHAPALRRTYRAALGLGAWEVDDLRATAHRLAVSEPGPLAGSLVATGFGYRAGRRAVQGAVLAALLPQVRDIRRAGAASLDLCAVGAGHLDGFYERGLHPWDLAAGQLVVTEAGGVVSGLRGRPPGAEMTVAGPGAVVERLAALLEDLGADRDDDDGGS